MTLSIYNSTGYTGSQAAWAALKKASYLFGLTVNSTAAQIKTVTDATKLLDTQLYSLDDEVNTCDIRAVSEPTAISNITNINRVTQQVRANTKKQAGNFGYAWGPQTPLIGNIDNCALNGAWSAFVASGRFASTRLRVDMANPQWYYQDVPGADNNKQFFIYMQMSFLACLAFTGCKSVVPWFSIEIVTGGSGTAGDFLPLSSVQTIVAGAASLGVTQMILFAGNSKPFSSVPSDVRDYIASFP